MNIDKNRSDITFSNIYIKKKSQKRINQMNSHNIYTNFKNKTKDRK